MRALLLTVLLTVAAQVVAEATAPPIISAERDGEALTGPVLGVPDMELVIWCRTNNGNADAGLTRLLWKYPNGSEPPIFDPDEMPHGSVYVVRTADGDTWQRDLHFVPFHTSLRGTYTCVSQRMTETSSVNTTVDVVNAKVPDKVNGVSLSKEVRSGAPALRVTWVTPQSDVAISHYEVQYRSGTQWKNAPVITVSPPATTTYLENLQAGTSFSVRVRAVSAIGNGDWSGDTMEMTYNTASTPTTVTAEPVERLGVIRVSWGAPSVSDGELQITGYSIQYKEQGTKDLMYENDITSTATMAEVAGLKANTTYRVYVASVNALGIGKYCCERNVNRELVTTYKVPAQVTEVSLSKKVRSGAPALRVTWDTPQSDVAISRYEVQYRSGTQWKNTPVITVSPPATTTDLESLQAGTSYSVRVRAVSAIGDGDWSGAAMMTTYNVPAKVTEVSLSKKVRSGAPALRVTWDTPQSDVAISRYEVQYRSGTQWKNALAATVLPPATTTDLESLQAGTSYSVRVRAVSAIGYGDWSDTEVITAYTATARPEVKLTKSTLHSLSVTWTGSSAADVTSFTVSWSEVPSGVRGSHTLGRGSLPFTIHDLVSNTGYTITVEAAGPLGKMNSSAVSFYTAPRAPSLISVAMLPEQILRVSWQPAIDAKDHSFVAVHTQFGSDSQSVNATSTGTMLTISRLPKYTSGVVTVLAKNPSAMSKVATVQVRTVTIDTNVTAFSAQWIDSSFTAIQLSWEPVTVENDVVAMYTVSYSPVFNNASGTIDRTTTLQVKTKSSTVTVSGLNPMAWYFFHVEIDKNEAGTGSSSLASGVGIGIATTFIAIIGLTTGLLLCCCIHWYKRQLNKVKAYEPETEMHCINDSESKFNAAKPVPITTIEPDGQEAPQPSLDDQASIRIQPSPEPECANVNPGSVSKTVFPAHVKEMHQQSNRGLEKEFQNLRDDQDSSTMIAKLMVNQIKNRYLNIHTFDHSRVVLSVPDESGSDYINASYIDGYMQKNAYIAAQGPKPETISDFWQMVVDHKPSVVVMLTKVNESGKRKCEQYWNEKLEDPYNAGRNITVTTTGYRTLANYEVRDLTLQCSNDRPHKLTHFQYTSWPDHGVPLHPSSLIKFVQIVRKVHSNSQAPMVVHCSAGVGRTGTFITLDAMMERLKESDDLNIFEFVTEMRTRRTKMIQTPDQYVFIHDALSDFLTCGDTSVPAHELRKTISTMSERDGEGKSGFKRQFEFLGTVSKVPVSEDIAFATTIAIQRKNRYKDKMPYSNNYLHLTRKAGQNQTDYINATFVDSYSRRCAFVAAQSPLESTRTDVWELIWQLKIKTVVLLCPLKENKKEMCSKFWPEEPDGPAGYPPLQVRRVDTSQQPDWDMIHLEVVGKNKSVKNTREVTLFHFHSWMAESCPSIASLLKMMGEVKKRQDDKTPTMVMCDDGMSRSGVFITCMSEIERVKVEGGMDIFQTVKIARAQRPHMVGTHDQYKLCFEILQSHLDSFDTYANYKAV